MKVDRRYTKRGEGGREGGRVTYIILASTSLQVNVQLYSTVNFSHFFLSHNNNNCISSLKVYMQAILEFPNFSS